MIEAPTPPVVLCRCGHTQSRHDAKGTCWATVWVRLMLANGNESPAVARYCHCYEFEP